MRILLLTLLALAWASTALADTVSDTNEAAIKAPLASFTVHDFDSIPGVLSA